MNENINENTIENINQNTEKNTDESVKQNADELNLTSEEKPEMKAKTKKGWKKELKEWIFSLVYAVIIALLVRTFIFEPVRVSGGSMKETLQNGEIMLVTKYDYLLGSPERFDIITCHYPNRKEAFVKRIVGLPGDTVSVIDGKLHVNDIEYEEDYIVHRPEYELDNFKLADDEYFVLGDNRSNSNDSHIIGPIKRNQIIGHVRLVVFPFSQFRNVDNISKK